MVNISKFHKYAKNYQTGTGLQHAQLGLVSIIAVKFHEILTNGFQEIEFTNSYKNVKVNISKFHNSVQNHRTGTGLQHSQLGLISIIAVRFHEILTNGIREIVFTNSYTNLKLIILKFHNSAKNYRTGT